MLAKRSLQFDRSGCTAFCVPAKGRLQCLQHGMVLLYDAARSLGFRKLVGPKTDSNTF